MTFIQIIEHHNLDFDTYRKVHDEWETATEGTRTVRRAIVARDRNHPDHYVTLAFFDSYESAMENSKLPGTQAAAEQLGAAADKSSFLDLDVIEDQT